MTNTGHQHMLPERMERIEQLIARVEECPDPGAVAAAREMVQTLLDVHASGLGRMLQIIAAEEDCGEQVIAACRGDETVQGLLLLHGLHPDSLEERVLAALEQVRPYLNSHGGDVELVELSGDGVRLRMEGSCHGCPSSQATLKLTIEQAILALAPDVGTIELENRDQPEPAALVQLESGAIAG
jgi:Fe-S cluster biogenesis protein NfuA